MKYHHDYGSLCYAIVSMSMRLLQVTYVVIITPPVHGAWFTDALIWYIFTPLPS